MMKKIITRLGLRYLYYRPYIPPSVDQSVLIDQVINYFGLSAAEAHALYETYQTFHINKGYEQRLGEKKTLCFEEAFLLYVAAHQVGPSNVVEIGTQYGRSTRRIIDLLALLRLNSKITCFDIVDEIKFVSKDEIQLNLYDVTHDFSTKVLEKIGPGLIYLDARPYMLLKTVISGFLKWSQSHPSILAIHDCSPGLYNPRMRLSKETISEPVSSQTGIWERHVLSETFAVPNKKLDDFTSPTHRLQIFNTPHGLALITPTRLLQSEQGDHGDL